MKLFNKKSEGEEEIKRIIEEREDIKDAIIIYMKPNRVYTLADLLSSITEEYENLTAGKLCAILTELREKEKIIEKTEIIKEHRKLKGYYTTIYAWQTTPKVI